MYHPRAQLASEPSDFPNFPDHSQAAIFIPKKEENIMATAKKLPKAMLVTDTLIIPILYQISGAE